MKVYAHAGFVLSIFRSATEDVAPRPRGIKDSRQKMFGTHWAMILKFFHKSPYGTLIWHIVKSNSCVLFGRIVNLKKSFRLCLTFNMHNRVAGHVAMLGPSRRKDKVASLYFTISIKEQTTKSLRSIFFLNSN